jgi:hypothetical protein
MARDLEGFPYLEAEFAANGRLLTEPAATDVSGLVNRRTPTDLIMLVHGWNNTATVARELYRELARSLRAAAPQTALAGRTIALYGVLWPSAKWDWFERLAGTLDALDARHGTELTIRLDGLREVFTAPEQRERLAAARALLPDLERSSTAQREFVALVRGLLPARDEPDDDAPDQLFALDDDDLAEQLTHRLPPMADQRGDFAVPADSLLWNLAGGFLEGARRLVDFVAYYEMKERAGTVGRDGLARFLRGQVPGGIRVHLVGHSFGARLVSAAAAASGGIGARACSMTLLQGAFSHFGFASNYLPGRDGLFRPAVTSKVVSGPLLITHTRNDQLVSIAYGIASQLAGQTGADVFGPASRYGGIGANGAQNTPEVAQGTLLAAGRAYNLRPGVPHNLNADAFIANHSAVTGREVAHAILSGVAATP